MVSGFLCDRRIFGELGVSGGDLLICCKVRLVGEWVVVLVFIR